MINDLLEIVDKGSMESNIQSGYLSGKNNLVDSNLLEIDKEELVDEIKTKFEPNFDYAGKQLVVSAIQAVLKDDNIPDATQIGFMDEGYTKQDIIEKQTFSFADLIANVYYYVVIYIDNRSFKESIKEIDSSFFDTNLSSGKNIRLITKETKVFSKVPLTLDSEAFDEVFNKIGGYELFVPNNSTLEFYCLDVTSSKIDYTKIQGFIQDNIGRYIYSRAARNSYEVRNESSKLAVNAIRSYKRRVASKPTISHFNELMLYSFLECVLHAPKIFSKMELQDKSGLYESTSSGIHILTLKKGDRLFNQLIFGATDTIESLNEAIDNAFQQVINIKNSTKDELELLETTILNQEFGLETNKALEAMIIPKKGSGLEKPDPAFGLFLGYSVDVAYNPVNDEYKKDIKAKLEADLKSAIPYIERKIKSLGLESYSFYIFALPLNDALIDTQAIMSEALEV